MVLAMQIRVPMLDEQEYAEIASLFRAGMQSVKEYCNETGASPKTVPLVERFAPMLSRYEVMTGYSETNPNAVMHHRLSLYGPPCSRCGKPLRTPMARICGCCMASRSDSETETLPKITRSPVAVSGRSSSSAQKPATAACKRAVAPQTTPAPEPAPQSHPAASPPHDPPPAPPPPGRAK